MPKPNYVTKNKFIKGNKIEKPKTEEIVYQYIINNT